MVVFFWAVLIEDMSLLPLLLVSWTVVFDTILFHRCLPKVSVARTEWIPADLSTCRSALRAHALEHVKMKSLHQCACWMHCETDTGATNDKKTWKMRYYSRGYNALLDNT